MKIMKAKTKRIIKICVPVALALCIIVAAAIFITNYEPYNKASISKDPEAQLLKSYNKTMQVLESGMSFQIPDAFWQSFSHGSIGAVLKAEEGPDISGMMFLRKDSFSITGAVSQDKMDPIKYGLYVDDENIAVDLPTILKDTVYGIRPLQLKEDLKDSDLLKVLQLDYADVVKVLDAAMSMRPDKEETRNSKDWLSMMEMKVKLKMLFDKCAVTVSDGTLATDLGGVNVYRVSYAMTPAQMSEALDILVNWFITTEFFENFSADLDITEIKDNLEQVKKKIVDSNATAILNFYLNKKNQIINQADFRLDWFVGKDPATIQATMKLGADPVQSLKYSLELTKKLPKEDRETITIVYERSHAHNLPGRKLVISNGDSDYTLMELQVNSVTRAFTLHLFDNTMTIKGDCKSEGDKVYATLEMGQNGVLSLTFTGTAEAPKMPEYINICTLPELELLRLFIEYLPERNLVLTIRTEDRNMQVTDYYTHKICTLGELLVAESLASLDDQGKLLTLPNYEPPMEGIAPTWEVYLNGELVEGSLNDVIMDYEVEIEIRDVTDYPDPELEKLEDA